MKHTLPMRERIHRSTVTKAGTARLAGAIPVHPRDAKLVMELLTAALGPTSKVKCIINWKRS